MEAVKNWKCILRMRRSQFNTLVRGNSLLLYFNTVITAFTLFIILVIIIPASNILVATHTNLLIIIIVSINFSIFFLSCCHNLWSHLHGEIASRRLDFLLNNLATLIQKSQTFCPLGCGASHDIYWWGNEIDFNGNLWVANSNSSPESILDSINTLIGEARAFKVSPDLHCLLSQLPLNVLDQNLLHVLIQTKVIEKAGVCHRLFEVVISCALLLCLGLKVPSCLLVKVFQLLIGLESKNLSNMTNNGVDSLGLGVLLSTSLNVLLGDSSLGQINVPLVLVNPDHHHRLSPANPDQLVDGPDTPS